MNNEFLLIISNLSILILSLFIGFKKIKNEKLYPFKFLLKIFICSGLVCLIAIVISYNWLLIIAFIISCVGIHLFFQNQISFDDQKIIILNSGNKISYFYNEIQELMVKTIDKEDYGNSLLESDIIIKTGDRIGISDYFDINPLVDKLHQNGVKISEGISKFLNHQTNIKILFLIILLVVCSSNIYLSLPSGWNLVKHGMEPTDSIENMRFDE